ncbi:MAG TPA: hypothetical protein VNM67_12385 [Thermoanaerobaculia bacterium]|jgi:hypothetical protein|nr:hypothetical protein [Thermoanaerobaculia bacterium]
MRSCDLRDALCWSFLSALVLLLLPIGHVSPDGLGQSYNLSAGFSRWNPNHLLVEPLGAWWMNLSDIGSRAEAADHLRRLSILAGSLAAGLFRFGVARRLAPSRLAANHATAWLAFSSAFARLWVMDEAYMVQMPAVVGVAWLTLRYLERPSFPRSLAAGVSVTLAAAFFIENLLFGPALALALWKRPKHAAGVLLGTLAAVPVFAAASPTPHVLNWMTRYGGGSVPARVEAAYGMADLFVSTARALYGSACALVDLAPLVAAFRDQMDLTVPLRAAAFIAACCALLFVRDRSALLLAGIWAAAVLAFGIYWNNSDDQFYVQLAVAFGALGARLRGKAVVLGMIALLWNVVDVGYRRVFYPRQERLATIEKELGEAGLIVYPGFDEMEALLVLNPVAPAVSMTSYSVRFPPEEGLKDLSSTILDTLREGRSVAVVDVVDVSPSHPPWKFLKRMGYDHAKVVDTLDSFALEGSPESVGPFTVRWIRPSE